MSKCNYCHKGSQVGNAVSHAKNRTKRLFKPNIHQLRVLLRGKAIRVALCAKCIKRLRRDSRLGNFFVIKYNVPKEKEEIVVKPKKEELSKPVEKKKRGRPKKTEVELKSIKIEESPKPAMSIEDIVGKKA